MNKAKYLEDLNNIKTKAKETIEEFIKLCGNDGLDADFITNIKALLLKSIDSKKSDKNYKLSLECFDCIEKETYDLIVILLGDILKSQRNETLEKMFMIAFSQSAISYQKQQEK